MKEKPCSSTAVEKEKDKNYHAQCKVDSYAVHLARFFRPLCHVARGVFNAHMLSQRKARKDFSLPYMGYKESFRAFSFHPISPLPFQRRAK